MHGEVYVYCCHGKNGPGKLWSGLYNIHRNITRALTIKLTQAGARTMAMARTTDRPRLRARARAWECVYV